jgi:hypothetical protein
MHVQRLSLNEIKNCQRTINFKNAILNNAYKNESRNSRLWKSWQVFMRKDNGRLKL